MATERFVLPTNVRPTRVELHLRPNFEDFTFTGSHFSPYDFYLIIQMILVMPVASPRMVCVISSKAEMCFRLPRFRLPSALFLWEALTSFLCDFSATMLL